MGRDLLAEGKSGKAVDWLERAIRINGNSAYHHDALGKALMEEGMKASIFRRPFVIRRPEKEFIAAIALHPDSIAPYLATGAFYHRQKRIADSISMYQKLLVLDPKNEDAKKELATLIREGK